MSDTLDFIVVPKHDLKFDAGYKVMLQHRDVDPLSVMSRFWCGWLIRDRFGILNAYSPYRMVDDVDAVPAPSATPLVFSDILDAKITEILNSHERLAVSWSGGVDSSAVVVGVLKNLQPSEYDRLTVVCSNSSIEEAPRLYEFFTNLGVNVRVESPVAKVLGEVECDAVLSGWCADQLFGSDVLAIDASLYHKPWIDAIKVLFDSDASTVRLTEKSFDTLYDVYTDYSNRLGIPVSEWCEFAWLFNFGVKFSFIQNAMAFNLHGTPNEGKAVNVFDAPGFQQYAVTYADQIKAHNGYNDPRVYKLPLKQYIQEFTNDSDYFQRKGKRNSWMFTKTILTDVKVLTDAGVKTFSYKPSAINYGFFRLAQGVGNSFRKEGR